MVVEPIKKTNVHLSIFNSLGIEIRTLVDESQVEGDYVVKFQRLDMRPGIFFYRLSNGHYSYAKKMTIIK